MLPQVGLAVIELLAVRRHNKPRTKNRKRPRRLPDNLWQTNCHQFSIKTLHSKPYRHMQVSNKIQRDMEVFQLFTYGQGSGRAALTRPSAGPLFTHLDPGNCPLRSAVTWRFSIFSLYDHTKNRAHWVFSFFLQNMGEYSWDKKSSLNELSRCWRVQRSNQGNSGLQLFSKELHSDD